MSLKISVVIPHRVGEAIEDTLAGVYLSNYNIDLVEIFQAEGTHPTVQRNACIKESSGDIIYFIDNDSIISPDNLMLATDIFEKDENVAVVGGPATHKINSETEEYIDTCLCSFFAVGPIASRYSKTKGVHEGSDRDLILCNLFVRRDVIFKAGLFNENLYPNEENALIDKIISLGYKVIHHPDITIERPPRSTIFSYIKMLANYGRGRFEQLVRDFNIKNLIFTLPMFFVLYTLFIPFAAVYYLFIDKLYASLYMAPFVLYLCIDIFFGLSTAFKKRGIIKKIKSIFVYPFMFFITHFFYGFGFFYGIVNLIFGVKRYAYFSINKHKSFK